jgi:hypothetical protein
MKERKKMITTNDIKNAKLKCYSIYEDLQSSLAGNSMTDPCVLEEQFNEICSEFGLNIEDTYEWCEFRNESTFLEAI